MTGLQQPPSAGSRRTHQKQRARLRRRLEADGVPAAEIKARVADLQRQQQAARDVADGRPVPEPTAEAPRQDRVAAAARRAQVPVERFDAHVDAWHRANRPDDTGYRPTTPDALARGAARVTGATLAAARRRTATTKHEHDRQERPA